MGQEPKIASGLDLALKELSTMTISARPNGASSGRRSQWTTTRTPNQSIRIELGLGRSAEVARERVAWVDYAKGLCIILVVMMHSTLGVESALGHPGFMHNVIVFAKPFRMPDFFLISGLFLSRVINRDWRTYIDRKVAHFAYFYVLWLTIQFAFKAPGIASEAGIAATIQQYVMSFIEPFGTLWFIYMLPLFFFATKLLRNFSRPLTWSVAAIMEINHIDSGWLVVDEFTSRYVYFLTGYFLAPYVFSLAKGVQSRPLLAILCLFSWGIANGLTVTYGYAQAMLVSLALGLAGAMAVIAISALMATNNLFWPFRYCGRHSIVIYLAFFLPMAASRTILIRSGIGDNVGMISLAVTLAGILGALSMFWLARARGWLFLFERPKTFRLPAAADHRI